MDDLALHTVITETHKGTADFDAIHRSHHQTSRPGRAQYPVALQLARDSAAQPKHRLGIVSFQRVSHGIFTERPDPFRQHTAPLTGRLDAMESGILASRAQKHGVKDLLPLMPGRNASVRQSFHLRGKVEHLVQIGFERCRGEEAISLPFFLSKNGAN
jgi:hypothetical protein